MRVVARVACVLALSVATAAAQAPVSYKLSFPEPQHRWMQVEATFPAAPQGPLEVRMSRSSPGRYAVHEFAKNVFDVHAVDGKGKPLTLTRKDPYSWFVGGHDGTVTVSYKIFGDHLDGTYLAIDTTHAHLNMPAAMMWARGFDMRPIQITIQPPAGLTWRVATQLYPTADPWTFTAPNLQYMMDSPTEVSNFALRTLSIPDPATGKTRTFRVTMHYLGPETDIDAYAAGSAKIIREEGAVFGEFPDYEPGTYTIVADYLPWADGDGMEHRNSTCITGTRPGLGTVAHEFFHNWNVERIRPQGLEPFNFEDANLTDSLWLGEGFTQYYGALIMGRTGLSDVRQTIAQMGGLAGSVLNGTGRNFHSAVEMSHMAPFTDAARAVDRTNFSNTFISYYAYGGAIALGLDLSLRDFTNGKVTLDDYMRQMWKVHGKPGGPAPGLVGKPYSLKDARDRLAEVSGSRAFADEFFDKYIEGREVVDYAKLLERAGVVLRKRYPGRAWLGAIGIDENGRIGGPGRQEPSVVPYGTPAYAAGLELEDVIDSLDGEKLTSTQQLAALLQKHKPGDTIRVALIRRGGQAVATTITLAEDPAVEAVPIEAAGGVLSAGQKAFREAWLGSKQPH